MPIVYEVFASYKRTVQPKDYESAAAEISLKAQLEEGDDLDAVSAQLLHKCRDLTIKAVTGKVLGKTEAEVEVKKTGRKISEDPENRGEAEDAIPGEEEETAADKKKRVAAEKRKATAAKKKAEAEAVEKEECDPPGVDDDTLTGHEDADDSDTPGTEDADGGDYDTSAFGDEEEEQIDPTDLQRYITGSVAEKLITVSSAKEIMSQFGDGAGRVKDIPTGSRNTVHAEIKKAVAATQKKAAAK